MRHAVLKKLTVAQLGKIPHLLWNPKVHYRFHNSLPLVCLLSQMHPLYTLATLLRPTLILFSHLSLGISRGLLRSGFPTKILYAFLISCACCTRLYPKVSGLAAWSENCKWYSSLSLVAVVSLFCESV
jgi:hypothetical protein